MARSRSNIVGLQPHLRHFHFRKKNGRSIAPQTTHRSRESLLGTQDAAGRWSSSESQVSVRWPMVPGTRERQRSKTEDWLTLAAGWLRYLTACFSPERSNSTSSLTPSVYLNTPSASARPHPGSSKHTTTQSLLSSLSLTFLRSVSSASNGVQGAPSLLSRHSRFCGWIRGQGLHRR
jgi:hypothetical protein